MAFFEKTFYPQVLLWPRAPGDVGYLAAVLPAPPPLDTPPIDLAQMLTSTSLAASLVFLRVPVPADAAGQQAFANAVLAAANGLRCLFWSASAAQFTVTACVPITQDGARSTGPLSVALGPTLSLTLPAGVELTAAVSSLTLDISNAQPIFGGPSGFSLVGSAFDAAIPVDGPYGGCLAFGTFVARSTLAALNAGFCFGARPVSMPASPLPCPQLLQAPLLAPDTGSAPQFLVTVDPLDPANAAGSGRTALGFAGRDLDRNKTVLRSRFTSAAGNDTLTLAPLAPAADGTLPARLLFQYPPTALSEKAFLNLAPAGDFVITWLSGTTDGARLLCGLQGTEYLLVHPGDRLRFCPGQPAWAPDFPFQTASPTAAPPSSPLPLTGLWTTSYATLVPADAPVVAVAQPPGLHLYGNDTVVHADFPHLLGNVDPGQILAAVPENCFPLVPYAGVVDGGDRPGQFDTLHIAAFESQVLVPARRRALTADTAAACLSARAHTPKAPPITQTEAPAVTFVTPNGFLVTADAAVSAQGWRQILLARLLETGQDLAFDLPGPALMQAFQSGALMLVCANPALLGSQGGDGRTDTPHATFANTLTIGGWEMTAGVGTGSGFGDYANVMLVKGVAGVLYDPTLPAAQNLVANPAKWTMAAGFAAPTTNPVDGTGPTPPDPTQLPNLAAWLQQYFADAAAHPDDTDLARFNAIAIDRDWTGILVLRATISSLPEGLAGIVGGITDPGAFNVHHLAIPMTPTRNGAHGPEVAQSSAVSGLIHYLDPEADPAAPGALLPAAGDDPYGFRLLSLRVAFENSAVKSFASHAQLTLRSLLGMTVTGVGAEGNPIDVVDAIALQGSYQLVAGQPVYSMASTGDARVALDNAVLPQADIRSVQMATVSVDQQGTTASRFTLAGMLGFAQIDGVTAGKYDLFGYGPAGLPFANLLLDMTFPTVSPGQQAAPTFASDASALRFDLGTSRLRPGSLVDQLGLALTGLLTGADDTLDAHGYLPVIAPMIAPGDLGSSWNALQFNLTLGSPGALAGRASLHAGLMLAWSTASGDANVQIGLALPGTAAGAPLISLQTVLGLSVGQVRLVCDPQTNAYMLLLDEIALTFLGLLRLPPNGNTTFYLFGNRDGSTSADGLGWYAMYAKDAEAGMSPSSSATDTAQPTPTDDRSTT